MCSKPKAPPPAPPPPPPPPPPAPPPAPPPPPEVASPIDERGSAAQSNRSRTQTKRRGKGSLRIDLATNAAGAGNSGLNIPKG